MSLPQITITPAGFAAIVNAEHDGTAPVRISHVGVTPLAFNVDTVGAALPGEIKRISTFGGKAVAVDTLHLNIRDDSSDTYTLRGFGLYLSNGVLFAVYSQATPIMEKAAAATLLLATDIRFAKITATSIEVGDVDFINPPASTTIAGVARFATDDEAAAGSSNAVAVTPSGLAIYVDKRFGNGAPSDFFKSLMTKATAALLRTALALKSAALKDEGAGNGLDADLLDGQQGAYYLEYKNITGLPTQWTPAPHNHPVSQVDGLQDALDGKVNKSGDRVNGTLSVYAPLRMMKTAAAITLYDDAGRALDYPNIQILAGLNSATDGHGVIINRIQTGALALWARAGECQLTVGTSPGLTTITRDFRIMDGSLNVWGGSKASVNLYDRSNTDRYWSVYSDGTWMSFWLNGAGNMFTFAPNGALNAYGGYDVGSSRKLKEIAGPLPYGLDAVRRISTVIGSYKPEYNPDSRIRLFFDAEQLMEVIPEMVDAEGAEFNGERVPTVKLDQGLPVIFNAVRELAEIVDQLRLELRSARENH